MPLDTFAVPDHLSARNVFKYSSSAVQLGTNTQVEEGGFLSDETQENDDARVIDLEIVRRKKRQLQQGKGQEPLQSPLLQLWYALAHSGISSRNFGRLQNAANEFDVAVSAEAANSLRIAISQFLHFWRVAKSGKQEPELHVASSGRLQALWSHPNGWFLVIEFGKPDEVFWAVYQDADIVEGQKPSGKLAELAHNLLAMSSKPLKWHC